MHQQHACRWKRACTNPEPTNELSDVVFILLCKYVGFHFKTNTVKTSEINKLWNNWHQNMSQNCVVIHHLMLRDLTPLNDLPPPQCHEFTETYMDTTDRRLANANCWFHVQAEVSEHKEDNSDEGEDSDIDEGSNNDEDSDYEEAGEDELPSNEMPNIFVELPMQLIKKDMHMKGPILMYTKVTSNLYETLSEYGVAQSELVPLIQFKTRRYDYGQFYIDVIKLPDNSFYAVCTIEDPNYSKAKDFNEVLDKCGCLPCNSKLIELLICNKIIGDDLLAKMDPPSPEGSSKSINYNEDPIQCLLLQPLVELEYAEEMLAVIIEYARKSKSHPSWNTCAATYLAVMKRMERLGVTFHATGSTHMKAIK